MLNPIGFAPNFEIASAIINNDKPLNEDKKFSYDPDGVKKYLASGMLTQGQADALADYQIFNLDNAWVQKNIDDDSIKIGVVIDLSSDESAALGDAGVQQRIDEKLLKFDEALQLTYAQRHAVGSTALQHYRDVGLLTFDESLQLFEDEICLLEDPWNRKQIDQGTLNIVQVRWLAQTDTHGVANCFVLSTEGGRKYLDNRKLNLDQLSELSMAERLALDSRLVQNLFDTDLYTIQAVFAKLQKDTPIEGTEGAKKYLQNGKLNLERAVKLTLAERLVLDNSKVQELIDTDVFSVEEIYEALKMGEPVFLQS